MPEGRNMSMIHQITAMVPRYRNRLRKGRGESSGHGKTCGRGTKGAKARQGKPHWKPGHEGGQTPLHRRLPACGFSNDRFAARWYTVNVSALNRFEDGSTVDAAALAGAKLVPDTKWPVKILGDGEIFRKLTVKADSYSKSACAKIIAAGGSALTVAGQPWQPPKPRHRFVPRTPEKGAGKAGGKEKSRGKDKDAAAQPAPDQAAQTPPPTDSGGGAAQA